jgi:HAD superfamily hydrolase (TIGR01509 family)
MSAFLNSWTPDAVVFDCDGTLLDTEHHWHTARAMVLERYDTLPTAEFTRNVTGVHYRDCARVMAELVGTPTEEHSMTGQLLDSFRAQVEEHPQTMPGVSSLVAELSEKVPLAVASNCPGDIVRFCLDKAGLLDHFEDVLVPTSELGPKPAPDLYAHAAHLLNSTPARTLAVEDSLAGVTSARSAGLRVMGVGSSPDPQAESLSDHWTDSLQDRTVRAWVSSFASVRGRRPVPVADGS